MKVKNKITIIMIAVTFAFIFFSDIVFLNFFSHYIQDQEDTQINTIRKNADNFFLGKNLKYQGSVNDYSHWDDTYNFIKNNNQEYIDSNLIEDTFINIDVNFIILVGEDNSIRYEQYYDNANKKFTQFPANLNENMKKIIRISRSQEDLSSIIKLGNQFYFVGTSDITDSSKVKQSNGEMVVGKLIDETMIKNLNEMTDSNISFSTISNISGGVTQESSVEKGESVSLPLMKINKGKDTMQVEFIIPNTVVEGSSVLMTLTKKRDLFVSGMNLFRGFMLIYTT